VLRRKTTFGKWALVGRHVLEAGLETVADAGFRHQEARPVGIAFDLLAQLANQDSQILDVVALIAAPDVLQKLIVRYHKPDMGRQDMEQAILLPRQAHRLIVQ